VFEFLSLIERNLQIRNIAILCDFKPRLAWLGRRGGALDIV